MVLIEDPAGFLDVQSVLGPLVPRQVGDPLQVRANDLSLRRLTVYALESPELATHLLASFFRQLQVLESFAQFLYLGVAVLLAELATDRPQLLAQVDLSLSLAQLLLDLGANVFLRFEHGDLSIEMHQDATQAELDRCGLEELLLV